MRAFFIPTFIGLFFVSFLSFSTVIMASDLNEKSDSHARSLKFFDSADWDLLPSFQERKIAALRDIKAIQDVAVALISVGDTETFYAYCGEKFEKNKDKKLGRLKEYLEIQKKYTDRQRERIEKNEERLITNIMNKLYERSQFKKTSKEMMIAYLEPDLVAWRARRKEVLRRMLMHDMVWGVKHCTKIDRALVKGWKPKSFYKESLYNYTKLLPGKDRYFKKIAQQLTRK